MGCFWTAGRSTRPPSSSTGRSSDARRRRASPRSTPREIFPGARQDKGDRPGRVLAGGEVPPGLLSAQRGAIRVLPVALGARRVRAGRVGGGRVAEIHGGRALTKRAARGGAPRPGSRLSRVVETRTWRRPFACSVGVADIARVVYARRRRASTARGRSFRIERQNSRFAVRETRTLGPIRAVERARDWKIWAGYFAAATVGVFWTTRRAGCSPAPRLALLAPLDRDGSSRGLVMSLGGGARAVTRGPDSTRVVRRARSPCRFFGDR